MHPSTDLEEWNLWKNKVKNFYKESAPVFVQKLLDNRPFISVSLYNESVSALLDSGANQSCIGKLGLRLLDKFKISVDYSVTRKVTVADGRLQKRIGVCQIPLCVGAVCKIVEVLVVPSLEYGLILGSDFCRLFSLSINFSNDTWNIVSDNEDITVCVVSVNDGVQGDSGEGLCVNLSTEQSKIADSVVEMFRGLSSDDRLGRTDKLLVDIDTGDAKPFKKRQYRLSPFMLGHLNKSIDEMLRLGVIEPSKSPWNSPVLLTPKKNGSYRCVLDSRSLNSITKKDSYPLPRIDDILAMLRDAKFISSIDLRHSFWQIPLSETSKEKTAFSVPSRGLFQYTVLPFGLTNAAQNQQRLMDSIFGPELQPKVFCYLDDLIVLGSNFEDHIEVLQEVHRRLLDANLTVNFEKCQFFRKSLKYLGFVVDGSGLRTDPDKVKAMVECPRPKTTSQVKSFVSMCSWYRRFISHFSTLVAPLNDLLKGRGKNQPIEWTPEAEEAFREIKERLISAPILTSPDFTLPFCIDTDASAYGVGAVLLQVQEGEEKVIAYASRSLTRSERNLSTTNRELLALLFGLNQFRCFVEGQKFQVRTDHASLQWLRRMENPQGKLARWLTTIQQYDFEVKYRPGKEHAVPDFLSRLKHTEINVLDVSLEDLDKWYIGFREKILNDPASYPHWAVKDGFIYKHMGSRLPLKTNISEWKLVVPSSQRKDILIRCHDDPATGAHLGYFKTLKRIQECYYWPHLRKDVVKYVRRCDTCHSQKMSNFSRFGLMGVQKKVSFPFEMLSLDVMGPFPRSPRQNAFLVVASDYFSKFTLVKALRQATAQALTAFLEDIFLTYGVPRILLLDNAPAHTGKVFRSFIDKYKIKRVWYNCRYHPQVNPVERINRTIGAAIRCYIKDSHRDWDLHIQEIASALRSSVSEVTKYSPNYLVFGRKVPISGDFYEDVENDGLDLNTCDREAYVKQLEKLPPLYKEVQKRLDDAYKKNCHQYNLRRREHIYRVGDKVWKRNFVLSSAVNDFSAKLADRFVLCKVRKVLSNVAYELDNLDGTDAGVWHVSKLKPYLGSDTNP